MATKKSTKTSDTANGISYSVKQTYHTSMAMNARLLKYSKDKGIKPSQVSMMALNDFLNTNSY